MAYEFNKDQFACNAILAGNDIQEVHFKASDGGIGTTDGGTELLNTSRATANMDVLQNCKYMRDYSEKQKSELGYVDATNIQQRTWLHIANLVVGSAVLMYAIRKVT